MDYNFEFENIDTTDKAYVLGLFFADGCITSLNAVRISLVDEQLIRDVHKKFNFFNLCVFDYSIYNKNSKIQYSLAKKSKHLHNHLSLLGLVRRKSTINADKLHIPLLDKGLYSHFIRGYFDGNGSISIPKARPNLRRVEICSSSKVFIEDLINILKDNNINVPIYRSKDNTNSILYLIEWVKAEDIINFGNFIYNKADIKLDRKFNLFKNFKLVDKTDNNPKCPICKNNLKKAGTRPNSKVVLTRFKCKNCNKGFSYTPDQLKSDELLETPKALGTQIWLL